MTLHTRNARPASEELADAVRWYEERRHGLGREFYNAVLVSVDSIALHPEIGAAAFEVPDVRRVLVPRFPYQIVYRVHPDRNRDFGFCPPEAPAWILEAPPLASRPPNARVQLRAALPK